MPPPKRIQLSRAKGWRKPEGAVVVARPTKWGNPFTIGMRIQADPADPIAVLFSRQDTVDAYRDFICAEHPIGKIFRASIITHLRGKDLCCWCPLDQPCHADVLLQIANEPIRAVDT